MICLLLKKKYYLRGFKIEIDAFGSLILTRGKDSVKIRKVRHLYARMNKIHETVRLILSMPLNYDYRIGFGTRTEIREDGDGFPEILFKSGPKIVYVYYDECEEFFEIMDKIRNYIET